MIGKWVLLQDNGAVAKVIKQQFVPKMMVPFDKVTRKQMTGTGCPPYRVKHTEMLTVREKQSGTVRKVEAALATPIR